jgi:hypothetical protein
MKEFKDFSESLYPLSSICYVHLNAVRLNEEM